MAETKPTPKPSVKPMPTPSPSAGTNKSKTSSNTLSPSAQAEAAAAGIKGGTVNTTSGLPGQKTINVGPDGKPLVYYPSDYAETQFAGYAAAGDTAAIRKLQLQLQKLGAYPKGYSPTLGIYTPTDVNALNSIGYIGEQLKEPNIDKVFAKIQSDKNLLNLVQTGGKVSTATKAVTSAAEAASVLTEQFLNAFNVKPSAAEIKAYTAALNLKEKSSKTGLSSQERQDILLNVMNQKAVAVSKQAMAGNTTAVDEGAFGRTVRALRNAYYSNGVPTTEANLYKQATAAMRGQEAYNNVLSTIQINAKAMLPALGQYIDQGKNARDILNSHIQTYANIFNMNPDNVDLNDIAFVANDPNKLMSTTDMVKQLWNTNPKIKETQYYKDIVTNDARNLMNMIGIQ